MRYILSSQKDVERRISAADSTTITFRLLRFENETLNLNRLKKKGTTFYFHLGDFQNVAIFGGTKNNYGPEMDVSITESNIEGLNIKTTMNSLHVNNCVVDGLFFDQCEIGALNIQSCKAKTMTRISFLHTRGPRGSLQGERFAVPKKNPTQTPFGSPCSV